MHENKIQKKNTIDINDDDFKPNITTNQIYNKFDHEKNQNLKIKNIDIRVAGRIMQKRIMGKSSFITLQDTNGRIQIYVKSNNFSLDFYFHQFKKWNLGDIIGVTGSLFKTKNRRVNYLCN